MNDSTSGCEAKNKEKSSTFLVYGQRDNHYFKNNVYHEKEMIELNDECVIS